MSENAVFPGDKIASIEEYEAGYNTFDDGDMIRAATVGQKDMDKTTRVANIKHPKLLSIPKVGDVVIGTVAAVRWKGTSCGHFRVRTTASRGPIKV